MALSHAPRVSLRKRHLWLERALVLGLLLLGAGLRLLGTGAVPPGLYHDEAHNGLDALGVLQALPLGRGLPLYFEANNGREPAFIYIVATAIAVLGRSPLAVRIPSFFAGTLTLAATYDLARTLFAGPGGSGVLARRMGRLALATLAVTFWHVHLSRVGFRAVMLPLFTALYLAQGVRAVRSGQTRHWIAAGALYGASWYTYMAARFTPVAILAFLIWAALDQRRRHGWIGILRPHIEPALLRGAVVAGAAALLVLLPLGLYTLAHPDVVLTRTGQVSILSESIHHGRFWRTVGEHILKTAGMFTIRGDRIWRHNLAWRPVWDPALGLAFMLGLGVCLAGATTIKTRSLPQSPSVGGVSPTVPQSPSVGAASPAVPRSPSVGVVSLTVPQSPSVGAASPTISPSPSVGAVSPTVPHPGIRAALALILIWTGVMALPTLLAEDAPHFLRAVGVLPTAALIPAVGLAWLTEAGRRAAGWRRWATVAPWLLLCLGLLSTTYDYFVRYPAAPSAYAWFEGGAVDLAGRLNALRGTGWDGQRMLQPATGATPTLHIDRQLWDEWSALPFLIEEHAARADVRFLPEVGGQESSTGSTITTGDIYAVWPYREWEPDVLPSLPHPAYLQLYQGPWAQGDQDPAPFTTALIIAATARPPVPDPVGRFEGGIVLRAALVASGGYGEQDGDSTEIRLWWETTEPVADDYTVFVHYLRDGARVAQHDGQPGLGHLRTSFWQPGDLVLDIHPLDGVAPDPSRDTLRIGLYASSTGRGLRLLDTAGALLEETALELPVVLVQDP